MKIQLRLGVLSTAAIALAACAPLPSLPPSPGLALGGVRTITLGPAGGYQQLGVNVRIPGDACNGDAFVAGYQAKYYLTWNQMVGGKEAAYNLEAQQRPTDTRVQWNQMLYKGKRFNLNAYDDGGAATRYGLQNLTSPDYTLRCGATSYQKGQAAGMSAAMDAYKGLAAQERT